MAASPSYFPRITAMLVPASWGENCAYINHSGKEIESSQVVLLEKNPKTFLATILGSSQSHSTPSWAGVGSQSPKPWSFA